MAVAKKRELTFGEILGKARGNLREAEAERRNLEDAARTAKREEEQAARDLARLNRILYLANCTENLMVWHLQYDHGPNSYQHTAWHKVWQLTSSLLDASVQLTEYTNLKRDKWEVHVRLARRTMSEHPNNIHGGYTDHDYAKDKYCKRIEYGKWETIPGQELVKKFKSLAEAERYVKEWQERIERDHIDELEYERNLRKQALAEGIKPAKN